MCDHKHREDSTPDAEGKVTEKCLTCGQYLRTLSGYFNQTDPAYIRQAAKKQRGYNGRGMDVMRFY